ncbi:MAG: M28 family peptidase [Bacteroidales bacterium]
MSKITINQCITRTSQVPVGNILNKPVQHKGIESRRWLDSESQWLILTFVLVFMGTLLQQADAQDSTYARRVVKKLASPSLHGRGYLGKGQEKSAAFIRKEFRKMGLKPLGKEYYQKFHFPVNTFPGRQELSVNGRRLVPGKDFLADPGSPSLQGCYYFRDSVTGSECHAYPAEGNEMTGRQSISGAACNLRVPGTIILHGVDGSEAGRIRVLHNKLIWSVSTSQKKTAGMDLLAKDSLLFLKKLEISISARMKTAETQNVIACLPGTRRPDSLIFFTAHYDHLGMMGKKVYFPGANDNASGVALMLDLARYFTQHPPEYSLIFMASAAEEAGILGSLYFCEHPLVDLSRIRFLLNLDLAGTGSEGIMVVNATVFPTEFELLKKINERSDLLKAVKSRGEACNSDHCAFYRKGVPCFFIYTMGGITAYHDIYDRAETLPLDAYMSYCRLLLNFTQVLQGSGLE